MDKKNSEISDSEMVEYLDNQMAAIEEINQALDSLLKQVGWEMSAEVYFMWMYGTEPFAEA